MLKEQTCNGITVRKVMSSIIEGDDAGIFIIWINPFLQRDLQPAGDFVFLSIFLGCRVSRHTISDVPSIALPVHADMIWVEIRGNAEQGPLLLPVIVSAFLSRRVENLHFRGCDRNVFI